MTLLETIRDGAIGTGAPIDEVLQHCLVLASKLRNEQLRDWVRQELNGYDDNEELPSYRVVSVGIRFNAVSPRWKAENQSVPPGSFPERFKDVAYHVRLKQPVAQLQGWADDGDVRL